MSAFSVLGKLMLDTTAFMRSLAGVKNAVTPAANQIGQQFKSQLMAAIGAGALVSATKATLQKAFDVRRESGRAGVGTEEYQTLKRVADQTGESVDVLAEKLRVAKLEGGSFADDVKRASDELLAMGVIIADDKIQNLANLFQKLADITATMAPAIATAMDAFLAFHKAGSKGMESIVGSIQEAYGRHTGKKEHIDAGIEMQTGLSFQGQESNVEPLKSAVEKLIEEIRIAREVEQWWKDVGGDEAQKTKEKKYPTKLQRPNVSSLTQVGGYMSGTAIVRKQIDSDVADIKRTVNALLMVFRIKE